MANIQSLFIKFIGMVSLLFVMTAFIAMPAHAQSVGDACTATGFTSPIWVPNGTGGDGQFLVCDGSNWQRAIQFASGGGVGGGTVIGTSSDTCNASTEGGIRYNTSGNYLEFCNGSDWTSIASSASCDGSPAAFNFTDQTNVSTSTLTTSNILLITGTDASCNVNVSVSGGASPNFRICADSSCSSVLQAWTATNTAYDMNGRYLQVRDTTSASANTTINVIASVGDASNTWSISTGSSGSCGASPTIGDTCSDGSVYAGQSPDGNVDMYVARCDIGMSLSGDDCIGTRSMLPWNNGNNTGYVDTSHRGYTNGDLHTAGIIAIDSDSITAGTQEHQAAQACADLNVHGHTDWYLPARYELSVIYENLQDGIPDDGNADPLISGFATNNYWSSTEDGDSSSTGVSFSSGSQNRYLGKVGDYPVRCARMD